MIVERIARLPLRSRAGLAALFGAFGAFAQAPYDVPLAMLVSLAGGFVLWRASPQEPFRLGWVFATAYFALTLVWIVEPFQVDAARHGWMAPFALVFMAGGLALFWGGAFALARLLSRSGLALVLGWTAAEVLRAHVLTGFPWASPAQVVIDGAMAPLLSLGGPHLATLALMLLACAVTSPRWSGPNRPWRVASQAALALAGAAALSIAPPRAPSELSEHVVRIVQPNAAQHLKWRSDMAGVFFERQVALTAAPSGSDEQAPGLVVWSETAITWELGAAGMALETMSAAAGRVPLAFGALRFEGESLRNALAVLGPRGEIAEIYDKHHLVPFGEYIPFGDLARRLGLEALAARMGGFSPGPGPRLLDFGPLGRALPLICYEAVFAHEVNRMPERADFLLQITNDAWFGADAGPQQHLAQARMRAIEQGLPLVRSANTGISAMIDPRGRVIADLPLGEAGFIDAPLPLPLAPTPYSRTGDAPVFVLLLGALLSWMAFVATRRDAHSD